MARVVLGVQNLSVPRDPRVWREARTLASAGHEVVVVSPRDPGQLAVERREGVEIVRFPVPRLPQGAFGLALETVNALCWTAFHCLRLRVAGPIDVFHAANLPDTFFLVAWPLKLLGARFVFDQHDLGPELAGIRFASPLPAWIMKVLEWCSYRSADLVVAPNGTYRRTAIERGGVPSQRIVIIRNGSESVGRRSSPPIGAKPLVVAYAGVMGVQDGAETLLEAVAAAHRRQPGAVRLLMIGEGDAVTALRRAAYELGIERIVEWTGWLSGDDYLSKLHTAHVGVSPDPDDALSRASTMVKVIDYVSGGLPCLVSDLPESRVSAGNAARYFEAGDAYGLSELLLELVGNPPLLEEMEKAAVQRAPALSWTHSARELISAYEMLIGGGQSPAGSRSVA